MIPLANTGLIRKDRFKNGYAFAPLNYNKELSSQQESFFRFVKG